MRKKEYGEGVPQKKKKIQKTSRNPEVTEKKKKKRWDIKKMLTIQSSKPASRKAEGGRGGF